MSTRGMPPCGVIKCAGKGALRNCLPHCAGLAYAARGFAERGARYVGVVHASVARRCSAATSARMCLWPAAAAQ